MKPFYDSISRCSPQPHLLDDCVVLERTVCLSCAIFDFLSIILRFVQTHLEILIDRLQDPSLGRLKTESDKIKEGYQHLFDRVIVNDDIEDAIEAVKVNCFSILSLFTGISHSTTYHRQRCSLAYNTFFFCSLVNCYFWHLSRNLQRYFYFYISSNYVSVFRLLPLVLGSYLVKTRPKILTFTHSPFEVILEMTSYFYL